MFRKIVFASSVTGIALSNAAGKLIPNLLSSAEHQHFDYVIICPSNCMCYSL